VSAQHAVVVGGTRGLGLVVVERLLSRGFDVTILSQRSSPRHAGNPKVHHIAVNLEVMDSLDGVWTKA
jgi:NAD(P)-dependent dehydrogenase (short-subunit alcohol dehydrogenase family)